MTQPNNVLNTQKRYDSLIEEAAKEYSDHNYIDECVEISAFKAGAIQMAQWKDEQLSKCLENLEKEYIRNSGKGLYDNNEIAAKLATLKRIEEEMK